MADRSVDEGEDRERRRLGSWRIAVFAAVAGLAAGCANLPSADRQVALPDPPPQTQTPPPANR